MARHFSANQWPTAFNTYEAFGAGGYVYMFSILTTSNDGSKLLSGIFLNIDQSKLPYQYRLDAEPTTPTVFLRQLNAQGAAGYRLKEALNNGTTYFSFYVRDASRPLAKYTYRYERCVSNPAELFAQMNKNAAQGYRHFESIAHDGYCVLYIKDKSIKSNFLYEMVPDFNNTDDYLAKLNELGIRGYHNPTVATVRFVSNRTVSHQQIPLYYRDETQKDCTFSYTSTPLPTSPDEFLALLQKQEAKGFIYVRHFHASTSNVLIFVKISNCQYESMNIDTGY